MVRDGCTEYVLLSCSNKYFRVLDGEYRYKDALIGLLEHPNLLFIDACCVTRWSVFCYMVK